VLSYVKSACACQVELSRFLYEAGLLAKPQEGRKKPQAEVVQSTTGRRKGKKRRSPAATSYIASTCSKVFHRFDGEAVNTITSGRRVNFTSREKAIGAGKKHVPCASREPGRSRKLTTCNLPADPLPGLYQALLRSRSGT
jgi:hypothetical protein